MVYAPLRAEGCHADPFEDGRYAFFPVFDVFLLGAPDHHVVAPEDRYMRVGSFEDMLLDLSSDAAGRMVAF